MAMPKGRLTVRKNASALKDGVSMKLWDFEAPAGSTLERLESRAYLPALDAIDALEAHRSAAAAGGKFTEAGIAEDAKQFALTRLAPMLHRGRQAIAQARREAEEQRSKLTLKPPDKSDLVGAMRRQEMRTWLRSLPDKERNRYVAQVDRLDPEMALAITESPAELSGVLSADRKLLIDRALQAQHGDAIDKVLELERAVEIASHAVEAVRGEIARDIGVLDPHQFNQLAAPHERLATAPYLKKFTEEGVEVTRVMHWTSGNGGIWRKATPEEIAEGIYYPSFEDYRRAQGGEIAA